MRATPDQPDLFAARPSTGDAQAAIARARMREIIDRLAAAPSPPWTNPMGAILESGTFQRAMRLVPAEEAKTLWMEFDIQVERLYANWPEGDPSPAA